MRYECSYGYRHLTHGGWSGGNHNPELQEALQQAAGFRSNGVIIDTITVRAGRDAKLSDFFCVDDFIEWLESCAIDNIWWNEDTGDNLLVDAEAVQHLMEDIVMVNSYKEVGSIRLKVDWEKGDPKNGLVSLVEGEEDRLIRWMNSMEYRND